MTNQLKRPTFVSTFSNDSDIRYDSIDLSGSIPRFDEDGIVQQIEEVDSDFLYVAMNVMTWYQAMQDRMSDAEISMFQPVLERILLILRKMNGKG